MPVLTGTTTRQVGMLARWLLIGVFITGMVVLWRPGYAMWGAWCESLLMAWALWLLWQLCAGERRIPYNPLVVAMLFPAAVALVYAAQAGIFAKSPAHASLEGALSASLFFQMTLMGLSVIMFQSLLSNATDHRVLIAVSGAAMSLSAIAALYWGNYPSIHWALSLLGLAGVAVWWLPLWTQRDDAAWVIPAYWLQAGRLLHVAVGVAAVVFLAAVAPVQTLSAAALAALAFVVGGWLLGFRRGVVILGVGVFGALLLFLVPVLTSHPLPSLARFMDGGPFGRGDEGFVGLTGDSAGIVVLANITGWATTILFAGVLVWGGIRLVHHGRTLAVAVRVRCIVWLIAVTLTTASLLAPGGLFIPSVVLAVTFVWGLFPPAAGVKQKTGSGRLVLVVMLTLVLLIGLTRRIGLISWAAATLGMNDKAVHAVVNFFMALVLMWQIGRQRIWRGAICVVFVIVIGGVGELMQGGLTTWRREELLDWLIGGVGAIAALPLYLLCFGAKWCESTNVPQKMPVDHGYHRHEMPL